MMNVGVLGSLLIIVACTAGVIAIARYNHVKHRDIGDGWRYVYWQPWRKWAMGIVLALVIGYIGIITVLARSVMPT